MARSKSSAPGKRIIFYSLQGDDDRTVVDLVEAEGDSEHQVLKSASRMVGIPTVTSFEDWDKRRHDTNLWWRLAVDLKNDLPVLYDGGDLEGYVDLGKPHTIVISAVDDGGFGVTISAPYAADRRALTFDRVNEFLEQQLPDRELYASLAILDIGQDTFLVLGSVPGPKSSSKITEITKKTKPHHWIVGF